MQQIGVGAVWVLPAGNGKNTICLIYKSDQLKQGFQMVIVEISFNIHLTVKTGPQGICTHHSSSFSFLLDTSLVSILFS